MKNTTILSTLILASQSKGRQEMLRGAGVKFDTAPAHLDEEAIVRELQSQKQTPQNIAQELATAKAQNIAQKHPGRLVIGSDQILECDGTLMSKAQNAKDARTKLQTLRGKSHKLISAVSVVQDTKLLWSHSDEATLTMHNFDDEFLDGYIQKAGEALTKSVGAYWLEAEGAWLFSAVEGDYFTILGMPLLPLLQYLREEHGYGLH